MRSRAVLFLLAVALLATAANAAVFIAPKDVELIDAADIIVIGRVTQMNGEFLLDGDIATMVDIEVESVLKGTVPSSMKMRIGELGGVVGSAAMGVSASPRYWRRNRALIFIEKTSDGMRTWGSALGKFDFVNDRFERDLLVRWAAENEISLWSNDGHPVDDKLRDAQGFLDFIRERVQQQQQHAANPARRRATSPGPATTPATGTDSEPEEDVCSYCVEDLTLDDVNPPAFWNVEPDQHAFPASAYSLGSFRWETFDKGGTVTFYSSGTQPGYDSVGAAQRSLAAWSNDPNSNISYAYGGTRSLGFVGDGTNAIVFNDSSGAVPGGALAYAKWYGGAQHTYKGEPFISIFEGDVVVRSGINVSQKVFDEAVTHELGHTLGFRHSDEGTPSSTQAVMKAVLSGAYGAALGPWDTEAAHAMYGTTLVSTVPGTPTNLTATATTANSVQVTWNIVPGATAYEVERSDNNRPFARIATVNGNSFGDTFLTSSTTYLYRVRALTGTTPSAGYSNVDHATTVIFLDDPLVRGTIVKDEHIIQLRVAINAMRASVGLAPFNFVLPVGPGVVIRASHIFELQNALGPALSARAIPSIFTPLASGTPIRTVHIQELRNYVK
jgi:Dual-action HEIGH metallo-peptidase